MELTREELVSLFVSRAEGFHKEAANSRMPDPRLLCRVIEALSDDFEIKVGYRPGREPPSRGGA